MDKRVKFAEVFFTGKADHWLRSSKINTNNLSWSEFAVLLSNRFAAKTTYELFDSFRHLEHGSSVTTYIDNFEELMGKLIIFCCKLHLWTKGLHQGALKVLQSKNTSPSLLSSHEL
jgi:hypothetical protein